MKSALIVFFSLVLLVVSPSAQAQLIWTVGLDDDGWPAGDGGGPNASFVQEQGTIQPLPGSPTSPEVDQMADNDYYLAGSYTTTIPSAVAFYGDYAPVGVVPVNEEAAERAFAGGDNDLRYHFNLPETLQPTDLLSVTFDPFNLDTSGTDPRYGIEVYFNGVLVQPQIVIRPPQTGTAYTTPQFTLASVNAEVGPGFDNIVSLRGISYSGDGGGSWMGIDYVQLNQPSEVIPAATFPWAVGLDDNDWPVGDGGGPNATFVQETGTNPLPGNPASPEVNQQADDDYYFAGLYTTVIPGNGTYEPVGLVPVNEEAAERAFSGTDNDLRYHFNLPNEVGPGDKVSVSFDALNLDDPSAVNTDPRYGVEIYFNGVLVQPEIVIRPAQLGQTFTTLPFTLDSVNAEFGAGFDNIVTLRGINHSAEGGGQWMGIDYVQLNPSTVEIPAPVLPWSVGLDDDAHPFGEGGGTNANFIGVNFESNPLPGSPLSDVFDGDADDDYYFAGAYTTLVAGNGNYIPIGLVAENEVSTEKGFEEDDNELRFHFNLPDNLGPETRLFFAFDALELAGAANPRYGVEVYFNGVLVQPEILITPAELGQMISTPAFTLASVNAQVGVGYDNIITLRGINHSAAGGSSSVSFDYFRLTVLPTIVFPLAVGRDDNGWPAGDGGGPNATFVQEAGTNPLPGRSDNPEVNQQADDDYYFAGEYTTAIDSVTAAYGPYTPLGLVLANEEAAERAFAGTDNTLRYHFNLPESLQPDDRLQVTFDANNLDDPANPANTDLRYGIEVYFNGVLVQPEIIIRPAQLDVDFSSPPFTLASVNAQTGFGHDNIITLRGINYNNEGGGNWMGIDYVKLDPFSDEIPDPTFPWTVGLNDNDWPVGDGGGPNATFVQEAGTNPLPGNPASPEVNQQADDDYYFAGLYTMVIPGNGTYEPVGRVGVNEEAAERAFAGTDNDLRYHFNLPANLSPDDEVSISFDALNLDESAANTDPRYGIEVYFNGVLVQSEIVIRPAELGQTFTTPAFSLGSVNAGLGSGYDNIVTLKGINYSAEGGGSWMGIDYVQLNPPVPDPTFPWAVGRNDDDWPVGDGGGPDATFVQEFGTNPPPGNPASPEVNQQADDDYYFAGFYTTVIPGNGSYDPVGLVPVNEEAAERAFAGTDNDLRYHFNLPGNLSPADEVSISFDALNLDQSAANTDPRYGIEVYFNGVLVQPEIVIRPAELGQTFTTPAFNLGSVNAGLGAGFDNVVTLRGVNYSAEGGGSWMGIDYVQLNHIVPPPDPIFPWTVGLNDDDWPVGDGGGPNATFVQEFGTNPLPGNPASPEVNQQADDDYYFAGLYTMVIAGNGAYEPVGLVPVNEEAAERAFAGSDNDLRYHFNLPAGLSPNDPVSVSFDALNLDQSAANTDPRYGIEVYFNGVLIQPEIVIRPAQLGQTFTTPAVTLASVNAGLGSGYDNIVTLKGINYSAEGGGSWMGIDYVQLDVGVQDTTPPVVMCPNDVPIECPGVPPTTWEVSATDDVDGAVQATCVPPSSAGLGLGAHTVVCSAADAAGNQASCSFVVTVADTIPPTINAAVSSPVQVDDVCGQTVIIETDDPGGAAVSYEPTASDACGVVEVSCAPPSGTVFQQGSTTVTCTAVDAGGRSSSCSFTVTVKPENTCPTAQANVVPPFSVAEEGHYQVIAPDNVNAHVLFEGSLSSDADGDPLSYAWFEAPPPDGQVPIPPGEKKSRKKSRKSGPPGEEDCVFGKVAELTLQYQGAQAAFVGVAQKGKAVLFFAMLQPGEMFTFQGYGKNGDMSPEIAIFVDGIVNAAFDTSGRTHIGPGLWSGDFLIISGTTIKDGELCELAPPPIDERVQFGDDLVAERSLHLGLHTIELEVSDGECDDVATLLVEVITPGQAVETCIHLVAASSLDRKDQRPLIDTLKKAIREFDKGKFHQGVKALEGFIKKVEKEKSLPQAEEDVLVECAQYIIDVLAM